MNTKTIFFIINLMVTLIFTVESICRNLIHCPCGKTDQNVTICTDEKKTIDDPCWMWNHCQKCQDGLNECVECPTGFKGPLCTEGTEGRRLAKSRRKKRYDAIIYQKGNPVVQSVHEKYTPCSEHKAAKGRSPSGTYVNHAHSKDYCKDPGIDPNGNRVPTTSPSIHGFPRGSRLQYSCKENYKLEGEKYIFCMLNTKWSSPIPKCVPQFSSSGCGHTSVEICEKIIFGNKTCVGAWPWMVAISYIGNEEIICGGAVLSSQTIVTAAHCLLRFPSFDLYFGKFYVRENDAKVQRRQSNRIIAHSAFNIDTLDSDIALVTFFPPIEFSDRIRPICLPSSETTPKNLMTGRVGSLTGWGVTERRRQPNELQVAHLPVLTNIACAESYRRDGIILSITENMYCAGDEAAGDDISQPAPCSRDSGSPMVFYDSDTHTYTLEGLVSFGAFGQCGIRGRHGVFTKVKPFVEWIRRNMI